MEAAIIIIIIAVMLLIFSKRFKNLVRNDFYLEKPDLQFAGECKVGDTVNIRRDSKGRKIEVYCKERLIGLVPDDYQQIVARKIEEGQETTGEVLAINKSGYKVHVEMKAEVRDIVQ